MFEEHPLIGQILADDYKVISFIGKGGMGSVFAAHQLSLGRQVAVKILPAVSLAPEELHRFESEIATMATLCHPNIVAIHHRGKYGDPPSLYYVMEYLDGGSLKDYLAKYGKLPPNVAIKLILQVAEALSFAHEQGCIHRDIKPDNLLYSRNYRSLKIADFGIAKLAGANVTNAQTMIGTFLYAAPEQMKWFEGNEEQIIDSRADQYSLGVVLYEMLTGRPPYIAKNMFEMIKALESEPVPLSIAMGYDAKNLEWLVSTMLEKSRDNRFPNDEAMIEAISSIEAELASATSTRIFAMKSTDESSIFVQPPISNMPSHSQKFIIQNLQTMECSPKNIFLKKYKKYIIPAIVSIALLITLLFAFSAPSKNNIKPVSGDKVKLEVKIHYDPIPPQKYEKIQIILLSKEKSSVIKNKSVIDPGAYQLSVILPGYSCRQHGKRIQIEKQKDFKLLLNLIAIPRKVSSQIVNLATGQQITPMKFTINKQNIFTSNSFKPGKYAFFLQFNNYHSITQKVTIPPGNGVYTYKAMLVPLKEVYLSFKVYPFQTKHKMDIIVDNVPLSKVYFTYTITNNVLSAKICLPYSAKSIYLKKDFYYTKISVEKLYLLRGFTHIDFKLLMNYLKTLKKDLPKVLLYLYTFDKEKIMEFTSDKKEIFYNFLKSRITNNDYKNMENAIWKLRRLLNRQEKEERVNFLKIEKNCLTMPYKRRIKLWEDFLKLYKNGTYKNAVLKKLIYNQKVAKYEMAFRNSVKECYLSQSEKRLLKRMSKKLKSSDIMYVKGNIKKYIKQLGCDKNLEEMLGNQ